MLKITHLQSDFYKVNYIKIKKFLKDFFLYNLNISLKIKNYKSIYILRIRL